MKSEEDARAFVGPSPAAPCSRAFVNGCLVRFMRFLIVNAEMFVATPATVSGLAGP